MHKGLKYFSYGKEIVKGHLLRQNIPVLVTLCVTNRCNLRCRYCYEEYYDRNHREFTTTEIMALIETLSAMGTRYVSINGGEPLLRNDLEQIIDQVKAKNMLCHLSTNGLLLPQYIQAMKNVDSIAISLDGDSASHDYNRGKGTYDRVLTAFEVLKANHIPFHTSTVLTKQNKQAIEHILELARQYDFKAQFSALRAADSPQPELALSDAELDDVFKKILRYKQQKQPIFFSAQAYQHALNWPLSYNTQMVFHEQAQNQHHEEECYLKHFSCHIEANGLVYPCIVLVNKFEALNFLEVGFQKAWENATTCECKACYNLCTNDLNQIFGLRLSAIWNAFKIVLERIRARRK